MLLVSTTMVAMGFKALERILINENSEIVETCSCSKMDETGSHNHKAEPENKNPQQGKHICTEAIDDGVPTDTNEMAEES